MLQDEKHPATRPSELASVDGGPAQIFTLRILSGLGPRVENPRGGRVERVEPPRLVIRRLRALTPRRQAPPTCYPQRGQLAVGDVLELGVERSGGDEARRGLHPRTAELGAVPLEPPRSG